MRALFCLLALALGVASATAARCGDVIPGSKYAQTTGIGRLATNNDDCRAYCEADLTCVGWEFSISCFIHQMSATIKTSKDLTPESATQHFRGECTVVVTGDTCTNNGECTVVDQVCTCVDRECSSKMCTEGFDFDGRYECFPDHQLKGRRRRFGTETTIFPVHKAASCAMECHKYGSDCVGFNYWREMIQNGAFKHYCELCGVTETKPPVLALNAINPQSSAEIEPVACVDTEKKDTWPVAVAAAVGAAAAAAFMIYIGRSGFKWKEDQTSLDFGCHPPGSMINKRHGTEVIKTPIEKINVGDLVESYNGTYEPVIGISHSSASTTSNYFHFHVNASGPPLRIAGNHYLYANNRLVTPDEVKISDTLNQDGVDAPVTGISRSMLTGAYHLTVRSGCLTVDGYKTSVHVSGFPLWLQHYVSTPLFLVLFLLGLGYDDNDTQRTQRGERVVKFFHALPLTRSIAKNSLLHSIVGVPLGTVVVLAVFLPELVALLGMCAVFLASSTAAAYPNALAGAGVYALAITSSKQ